MLACLFVLVCVMYVVDCPDYWKVRHVKKCEAQVNAGK